MLQFYSSKAEGLSGRAKGALNHLSFKTPLSKTSCLDVNKPIISPFGCDSFEQIGAPPVSSDVLARSRGGLPIDLWCGAFLTVFPTQREEKEKSNRTEDKQFADVVIDDIRTLKDQELDRYRKISERKAHEAEVNAGVGVDKKVKKAKVILKI